MASAGPSRRPCLYMSVASPSTGTWGNTSCPTSWMRYCRTPHHSISDNPLPPLSSIRQPCMAHMGDVHNFHHIGKYGPSPKGSQFIPVPPFCQSDINWCHLSLVGVLVSITFSHRPDEAFSVRNWQQLVHVINVSP